MGIMFLLLIFKYEMIQEKCKATLNMKLKAPVSHWIIDSTDSF